MLIYSSAIRTSLNDQSTSQLNVVGLLLMFLAIFPFQPFVIHY